MKLFPDSKVYMICPANIHSGGPELCHQLVSQLIQLGVDAYIFYLPNDARNFNPNNPIDPLYVKYHVPYVLKIDDDARNILILNESANEYFGFFERVRKIVWWMSVDNYLDNISSMMLRHKSKVLSRHLPKFFYFDAADETIEHWVQSEYARQFVLLNGVSENRLYVVEDYLSQTFLSRAKSINLARKENLVAFNPLKGLNVTQRLMELAPDIEWCPIFQMTPDEVQNLLSVAKVYIDFGAHPGKDRIPREAALSGCVVITGRRGAAANNVDINIPAEFKFDEADLPAVIDKIRESFTHFEDNLAKQSNYRARIFDDRNRFANEVAAAFGLGDKKMPNTIAVAQGLSRRGIYIANTLTDAGDAMAPKFIVDDSFCNNENPSETFINRRDNSNFFVTDSAREIPIISSADARFLYAEGRINKFILFAPTDEEIDEVVARFNIGGRDLFVANESSN